MGRWVSRWVDATEIPPEPAYYSIAVSVGVPRTSLPEVPFGNFVLRDNQISMFG